MLYIYILYHDQSATKILLNLTSSPAVADCDFGADDNLAGQEI